MGLISNSNNEGVSKAPATLEKKEKLLTAQQKSFACSYAKDIVVALISQGMISEDQIEENIDKYQQKFEDLL